MGDVYQASDTKLGRSVAIKVLPDAFATDADRVARFEREARVLASLNHPHIAAIYGIEQSGGRTFVVMELAAGETLAARIARGKLPLDEALPIATQLAEALEAAHGRGIVHRDLKPANITVDRDSKVKVLDFGLAKAFAGDAAQVNVSNSPTMSLGATSPGMILGTAAYMSPEQAKGKETDRTTDIWAFGCVLYEMLTGRAAFEGETVGEILGSVFKAEPDWTRLPANTPRAIRRLLQRCLRKDAARRLRDIGDARIEIHDAGLEPSVYHDVPSRLSRRHERLAWAAGVVVLLATVAIGAVGWARRPAPTAPEMRFEIATPPTNNPEFFDVSPDGQKLVFAGDSEGESQLWVRSLDAVSAQPLAGTERAQFPFWSPDGQSVGFFADAKLKRIDIDGGAVQTLADVRVPHGGAWGTDGRILFGPHNDGIPIRRVSATGGEASDLTRIAPPQQSSHRFPQFLPDGRHILYYATGTPEGRGVYLANIDGSAPQRLFDADSGALYVPSGQLLFVRQGTLFAQDFDLDRLQLAGNAYPVASNILFDAANSPLAAASVSASKRRRCR
jgi:hypothetical protein